MGRKGDRWLPVRELREVLPQPVLDHLREQFREAATKAVLDFPDQQEDEDSITGALGSVIRNNVRGRFHWKGTTYVWQSRSHKLRGRGKNAPEKHSGADGFIEIVVKDENVIITRKLMPFQAKKMWSGTNSALNRQAAALARLFPGGGVVIDYTPEKYSCMSCEAVVAANGDRAALQASQIRDVGDVLADDFLPCKVGILGASYDPVDASVVQPLPDGSECRIGLKRPTRISTTVRRRK